MSSMPKIWMITGVFLFAMAGSGWCLSAFDCATSSETTRYKTEAGLFCSSQADLAMKVTDWTGSTLQLEKFTSRPHRSCKLLVQTITMYCTWCENPTQLERQDNDFTMIPTLLSGQDCIDAWDKGILEYKEQRLTVKKEGVTKILIGEDLD